jgi:hypothetical protein
MKERTVTLIIVRNQTKNVGTNSTVGIYTVDGDFSFVCSFPKLPRVGETLLVRARGAGLRVRVVNVYYDIVSDTLTHGKPDDVRYSCFGFNDDADGSILECVLEESETGECSLNPIDESDKAETAKIVLSLPSELDGI